MVTFHPQPGEAVKDVRLTEDTLIVELMDERTIIVPLDWYPRLLHATPEQRAHWQICAGGFGIHWPEVDEDLSTAGLLRRAPAAANSWPHASLEPAKKPETQPRILGLSYPNPVKT